MLDFKVDSRFIIATYTCNFSLSFVLMSEVESAT